MCEATKKDLKTVAWISLMVISFILGMAVGVNASGETPERGERYEYQDEE
jgi:hypothetical protein